MLPRPEGVVGAVGGDAEEPPAAAVLVRGRDDVRRAGLAEQPHRRGVDRHPDGAVDDGLALQVGDGDVGAAGELRRVERASWRPTRGPPRASLPGRRPRPGRGCGTGSGGRMRVLSGRAERVRSCSEDARRGGLVAPFRGSGPARPASSQVAPVQRAVAVRRAASSPISSASGRLPAHRAEERTAPRAVRREPGAAGRARARRSPAGRPGRRSWSRSGRPARTRAPRRRRSSTPAAGADPQHVGAAALGPRHGDDRHQVLRRGRPRSRRAG